VCLFRHHCPAVLRRGVAPASRIDLNAGPPSRTTTNVASAASLDSPGRRPLVHRMTAQSRLVLVTSGASFLPLVGPPPNRLEFSESAPARALLTTDGIPRARSGRSGHRSSGFGDVQPPAPGRRTPLPPPHTARPCRSAAERLWKPSAGHVSRTSASADGARARRPVTSRRPAVFPVFFFTAGNVTRGCPKGDPPRQRPRVLLDGARPRWCDLMPISAKVIGETAPERLGRVGRGELNDSFPPRRPIEWSGTFSARQPTRPDSIPTSFPLQLLSRSNAPLAADSGRPAFFQGFVEARACREQSPAARDQVRVPRSPETPSEVPSPAGAGSSRFRPPANREGRAPSPAGKGKKR